MLLPTRSPKVALDTGFGHFDAFVIARWSRDQVSYGTSVNHDALGGGFVASAYIPVGQFAELANSVMYGSGVGRYGAALLPDVTFTSNGGLTTLPQGSLLAGATVHIVPKVLDFYGYYGWNWVGARHFRGGGYGNPNFNNSDCFKPNAGGTNGAGTTQTLTEFTAGFNWNVLRGRYGMFRSGLQYGDITRTAYWGVGGKPFAAEDLFMLNFRYIPFE